MLLHQSANKFQYSVLASPSQLPGFWIFMYRVSPFTYLVSSVLTTGVAGTDVVCSDIELLSFPPPSGQNCSSYLQPYMSERGGRLLNPGSTSKCSFCSTATTDEFLMALNINPGDKWRNIGLLFVYIVFNVFAAIFLYWFIRVPKKWGRKVKND